MAQDPEELSPRQKVAVLMIAMGEDTAAEILRYMKEEDIQDIAQTIAELGTVTAELQEEVLEEFEQLLTAGSYVSEGGLEFARGALEKALGPRKAQQLLDRVTSTTSSGFYMLRNVDPNQLIPYVSKEHPQTIALILSQLDPAQAAGVFNGLPEEMQADVAYRMSRMDTISPETLRELEESLAEDLKAILSGQVTEIGGVEAVAEMLNRTGRSTEMAVLDRLDTMDPEVAEAIRNRMFTFNDIAGLADQEIRMLLQQVDNRDLAVALKGASDEMKDRIFANVSERVAKTLREDIEFLGPVRKSEVEEVQLRIVQKVHELEAAGQVKVVRGDSGDAYL